MKRLVGLPLILLAVLIAAMVTALPSGWGALIRRSRPAAESAALEVGIAKRTGLKVIS